MTSILDAFSGWQGANLAFWSITLLVLVSAGVAALSRSVVQAAFGLFFTLVGMAGYYVLLGSSFLAVTQIVIYVGGILVLLMFGILLTNRPLRKDPGMGAVTYIGAGLLSILMLGLLAYVILGVPWTRATELSVPPSDVRRLGFLMLTQYLLPFEFIGMTLLLCLVGAAYLVRRRER